MRTIVAAVIVLCLSAASAQWANATVNATLTFRGNGTLLQAITSGSNSTEFINTVANDTALWLQNFTGKNVTVTATFANCTGVCPANQTLVHISVAQGNTSEAPDWDTVRAGLAALVNSTAFNATMALYNELWDSWRPNTARQADDELALIAVNVASPTQPPATPSPTSAPLPVFEVEMEIVGLLAALSAIDVANATSLIERDVAYFSRFNASLNVSMLTVTLANGTGTNTTARWIVRFRYQLLAAANASYNASTLEMDLRNSTLGVQNASSSTWMPRTAAAYEAVIVAGNWSTYNGSARLLNVTRVTVSELTSAPTSTPAPTTSAPATSAPTQTPAPALPSQFEMRITGDRGILRNASTQQWMDAVAADLRALPILSNASVSVVSLNVTWGNSSSPSANLTVAFMATIVNTSETATNFLMRLRAVTIGVQNANQTWLNVTRSLYVALNATVYPANSSSLANRTLPEPLNVAQVTITFTPPPPTPSPTATPSPAPTVPTVPIVNATLLLGGNADIIRIVFETRLVIMQNSLMIDFMDLIPGTSVVSLNTSISVTNTSRFYINVTLSPSNHSSTAAAVSALHSLVGVPFADWANNTAMIFEAYGIHRVAVLSVVTSPALSTPQPITAAPPPSNATPAPPTPIPTRGSDVKVYRVKGTFTITGNDDVFTTLLLPSNIDELRQRLAVDIAQRLNVPTVEVLSVRRGSLVVEFVVVAQVAEVATSLQSQIEYFVGDGQWLGELKEFYELRATDEQKNSATFPIAVSSASAVIETDDDNNDDSRQSNVVVVAVIVIIVIIILVVAGICCFKMNRKSGGSSSVGGGPRPGRSYASYAHETGDIDMHNQPAVPAPGTI